MNGANLGNGLVILDRDGVINRDSADFVKNTDEFQPLPGSIEAIAELSKAGFTVAVASNQSGLARGLFDRNALRAMHRKLRRLVGGIRAWALPGTSATSSTTASAAVADSDASNSLIHDAVTQLPARLLGFAASRAELTGRGHSAARPMHVTCNTTNQ